jgi:hypothetical protein
MASGRKLKIKPVSFITRATASASVSDAWFTLPEGCTFVAPPEEKPTFVTRWNGTEWIYLKDLRGQLAWNTETRERSPF